MDDLSGFAKTTCFIRQFDYLNLANIEPHSNDPSIEVCTDLIEDESFPKEWDFNDWIQKLLILGLSHSKQRNLVHHQCCKLYGTVRSFAICQDILSRGFRVNASNAGGMTLLQVAFRQTNYPLIYYLLEKDGRITTLDSNNDLPFMSSGLGEMQSQRYLKMVEDYLMFKLAPLIFTSKQ